MMNVSAIILAGGKATRMGEITKNIPKSMLPFDNIPFLEYLISWLHRNNIEQIILCVGHLSDVISNHFSQNNFKFIDFVYQPENLEGTGGAVALASHYVVHDNFFILNGDTIFTFEIDKILKFHTLHTLPITQVVSNISNQNQGAIKVDMLSNLILSSDESELYMSEKYVNAENFSSSGVYLVNTQFAKDNFMKEKISFEKAVVPKFIQQSKVAAYVESGNIYDFGTPERYMEAQKLNIKKIYS